VNLAIDRFPQPDAPKPTTDIVRVAANVDVPPLAPNDIAPVALYVIEIFWLNCVFAAVYAISNGPEFPLINERVPLKISGFVPASLN